MTQTFEIIGKFDRESDCQHLLYAPLSGKYTFRKTQLYSIEFEGSEDALKAFVNEVLQDPISQEVRAGSTLAFEHPAFTLEYGMKGSALDLEKEMILSYYRALSNPGFELKKLTLRTRIYVFGEGAPSAPFVRDICNPAIHTWELHTQAAA